jgi:putative sterol carrier protein
MKDNLGGFEQSLQQLIKKLDKSDLPRMGNVVFDFVGERPMRVALKAGSKTSIHRTLAKEAPRLEISGDPERIREVLEGKKDPRLAFLEGSITVRGDVDYLQSILRSLRLMD